MYRLIIVDDEKIIRKGIRDYIDWKSMNFEVVETFEDGKEALDYIRKNPVDVVLTDIEMAEISGLELAKIICEEKLGQRVVIVSGYKEFEYARKAVEYGVEHYLLKPIHMEEVKEVFEKIASSLKLTEEKNAMTELLPELRRQFWIELLGGVFQSMEEIRKRKHLLNLPIGEQNPFAIADLQIKKENTKSSGYYEGENYYNLIHNVYGGEQDGIYGFPVIFSEDIIKIILNAKEHMEEGVFYKKAETYLKEKCETANILLNLNAEFQMEKLFSDIMGIADYKYKLSIRENRKAEETKQKYEELGQEEYERLIQKYKILMGIINDGDFENLDHLLENIFHEFHNMPVYQVQKLCIDLFSMLSSRLLRMGIDMWKASNEKVRYQEFMELTTIKELKEKTKSLLYEIVNDVKEKQNISSKKFVDESISYMKKHYAEEISLESIANKFFLNQTYFSRLFKQYTGSTFTDYLIKLRMEKAKELLNTGKYKVYEVSQKVGYKSEKYFFRIFKQYTGCSPAEYYRGKKIDE